MSNFNFNAKNKKTGEIVSVNAYDDYFAKHKYAYGIKNKILSEEEFDELYEEIKD